MREKRAEIPPSLRRLALVGLFACLLLCAGVAPAAGRRVHVGVFPSGPVVFRDVSGRPAGFAVDLLGRIARNEGWELRYHWIDPAEGPTALAEGRVDLLCAVAVTEKLRKRLDFSGESIATDWALLYARPGASIDSILDVAGRTILLRRGDIHGEAFRAQLRRFGLKARLLSVDSYAEVVRRLDAGRADAGVVSRLFLARPAASRHLEETSVIFNPTPISFATASGRNGDLLERIDDRLRAMKQDPASSFHAGLDRWLGGVAPAPSSRWVVWVGLAGALALVFVLALNLTLRAQVRNRTKELTLRNRELFDEISERQQKEQDLRIARDHLQAIYEASPDMVFLHDGETGRLIDVNDNVLRTYGVDRDEMLSSPPGRFMGEGCNFEVALEQIRRAASGTPTDFQWTARSADGLEFPVEVRLRRLKKRADDDSGRVYVVAVVRDLRDQKRAEQEKIDLERQLLQAQKMESVGRLAGGVAHDFNNLLSSIIGYTELALLKVRDEQIREYLRTVSIAGEQAASLTRGLLAFSRTQVLQVRVVGLNEIVSSMAEMLDRILGEDISVSVELGAGDDRVEADRNQLEQVLMNLGANARDAMPDGGELTIGTAETVLSEVEARAMGEDVRPGRYVDMWVRDTGVGIDPSIQEKIFEPFFTTKGREYGTGLGLAITYGIVRQHGGHMRVESRKGEGTTFHICFPATGKPMDEEGLDDPAGGMPKGGETLLVVDDAAPIRQLVSEALIPLGYRVITASSADEAIALLETRELSIDLLLTDIVMPGRSGRELALYARELRPDLRIVFMSGYTDDRIVREDVEHSGSLFIQKPIVPQALARTIRFVLDGAKNPGP